MKKFTGVQDIGDLKVALALAFEMKKDRFKYVELGRNKTLLMVFFNSSLRTRLSTQKAAMNLGMNVIVLDINQGAWKLETERGVIMDGDKSEHILEAIPVMGSYCDIIGVRSFAQFEDRDYDYNETILNQLYNIPVSLCSLWRLLLAILFRLLPILSLLKNTKLNHVPKWSCHGLRIPARCRRLYPTLLPSG